MSRPSIVTVPSIRAPGTMSFMRFRVRRKVDLPQPDGPMSAVTWFGRISALIASSTRRSPYDTFSDWTSIFGGACADRFVAGAEEAGTPGRGGATMGIAITIPERLAARHFV